MSKDLWKRKQKNIDNRNGNNRDILIAYFDDENRGNEIADILEAITKMRHEIHNSESLFNSESSNYRSQLNFLNNINYELKQLGLPQMMYFDAENLFSKDDVNYELEDGGITTDDENYYDKYEEKYEEILGRFIDQKEKINNEIEKWLKNFDEKYGTNYCPTGTDRIIKFL